MNNFIKYDYSGIESPCYVVEEELIRKNGELIARVSKESGAQIIIAFKAFGLWKLFNITREYTPYSTASSLNEARMAAEKLGTKPHTYAPVYTSKDFPELARLSSHITFNSLAQFEKYSKIALDNGVSCGLRINPEFSDVETDLYNPCAPGSRLGITRDLLCSKLPEGIEGLHFHTLCESTSYDLEKALKVVEEQFGDLFNQIKWINFGGGHLMTRKDYDTDHLISVIKAFRERHPHLQVILEPGSAHLWRTGVLVCEVQDIVENHGIKTALLDVSFACHMPDCLEMPYQPYIIGAENVDENGKMCYRMGGNSCLSGDYVGYWKFDHELIVGEKIVFEDMNHYTNVKTTMFNGVAHPSIALRHIDGRIEMLREYTFEDYLSRMD